MKFLTTGEFAKLCGTEKGTLFFYDKEGLLRPKHVLANGYRRYGPEQFFEYEMLSLLKETGSSLKEIKLHMQKKDPKKLLGLFEDKRALLQEEKEKIIRRQKMLGTIVSLLKTTTEASYDALEVADMEAEALEIMPVDPEDQDTAGGCATLFAEFSQKLEKRGSPFPAPFGVIFSRENAVAKRYVAGHFFCGKRRSTPKASLYIRPQGKYAIFLHSGDMDSHKAAYVTMLENLKTMKLTVVGNIYAYDTLSYFMTGNADVYMAKYCIQVE